jgi:serine/threonine-protein kinase RsbT
MDEALIHAVYAVAAGDYLRAGEGSADIKRKLKQLGLDATLIRRVVVSAYEAEMNLVIHSTGGTLSLEMDEKQITLIALDKGPGIPDVDLAMHEGYSTANETACSLGFGAGMGLPNMRRNTDYFEITSKMNEGTRIRMVFRII